MRRLPNGRIDPFEQVDIADNVLNEVFRTTERLKVKAFLMYGTCLGFIRDGGYIKGDNDLDIGVICRKKKMKKLIRRLMKNGFTQRGRFWRYRNNIHVYKDRILIDFYFCKSGEFYSSLEYVQYKGKKYPVPCPVKQYLSACYSNWEKKEKQVSHYYGG